MDAEVRELQAEIRSYIKAREGRINTIDDLKAEIKTLKQNNHYKKNLTSEIDELKADLSVCKANVESLENVKGYLQKEKERLKAENKRIRNTLIENAKMHDELKADTIKEKEFALEMSIKNDKLKAENKQLTQTIKYSNGNDGLYDEIVESNEHLEEQIKELKDKLQAVNDDYNNDHKVHNEYADGLLAEIKELKENSKKQYPKEYQAEASEYFHHNPQAEKVIFYMLDNNEGCIDYDTLEQYEIASIDNDNI
mgnify:CR=1 FL=1